MNPLVIIPTFNERENIKELIPEILDLKEKFHILIVDDNSPDGTGKVAEEFAKKFPQVHVLHRKNKNGIGKAYIDGFKWALKRDFDPIFEMDADFSHDPRYLPVFLEKIKDYDLVVGSRYHQGRLSVVNWDLRRVWLSILAGFYAKIVTGVPVSDATTGFKCFKRRVLENIDLDKVISEGYSFQIEMNWRTRKAGFKIGEIPIIFYERRHGKSKMSGSIIREALWVLWRMRLKP
jgi:dolichol-phosphate mannosyltransferase